MSGLAACAGPPQVAGTAPAPAVVRPQTVNAADYAPPGPPGDPWGPYIREASTRFTVPEKWIREVMRQESGGHEYINGGLTTSSVGAMGLMQLMPVTYGQMRDRYGLGPDPYAPHDNIMAGTAYIREMYARYGSPGFLAAYNAGPGRLDSYLVGGTPLPRETVGYLASIAPRLGDASAPTGPLAHYAIAETSADDLNARSLNGTLPAPRPVTPAVQMASYQVPANTPSGDLNRELQARTARPVESSPLAAYAPPPTARFQPEPPLTAAHVILASANAGAMNAGAVSAVGGWTVQVGAFSSQAQAQAAASDAKNRAHGALDRGRPTVAAVPRANAAPVYRAQLVGLSADAANEACNRLSREHLACLVVAPHGTF
ncbi:MAG TPA: lytic transglycosylase domain-containing protein [Aliidongia sp.]|uniref:lytic transglycosylase domain-containing protein n=1 Tax=Aliidongia sp. TaxID=1914230 RepID=UPI002DDDBD46|nr:lytic transglycosylase domain-containing protein [Aliidongia sp.]HEV2676148.1 lytic transglycosylase domain-containing protein [Aliidongia sp.]